MSGGERKLKNPRASHKVSLKVRVKRPAIKTAFTKPETEIFSTKIKANRKLWPFGKKTKDEKANREAEREIAEAIIEKAEEAETRNIILAAKVEQQKKIIMWSGIIFFMILIGSLWLYNAKQILKPVSNETSGNLSDLQFKSIGDELSDKMRELKTSLGTINEFMKDKAGSTTATSSAEIVSDTASSSLPESTVGTTTATSSTGNIDEQELEALRQKLNELEDKINKSKK